MPLQITTTRPIIEINTAKGQMNIQQPRGEQTIRTTMPKTNIKSEKTKVIIDQYQCFAEAGLKNFLDLTKEAAQLGRQKALEAIARIAQDGDRLAMIQKNMPPAIPELAEKNAWDDNFDYNIGLIPKSRPKIEVKGSVNIDWVLGKVDITYKVNKPRIDYHRGQIDIYLKQKPSIDIQHVDVRA